MTPSVTPQDAGAFPLPELKVIGDAVCETLQLGSEDELLGDAILSKVRGLIARKQVTSADVVRIALSCDALRVAEEASLLDGSVSELEIRYTLPLVRDAAQRLAAFRAYYAQHIDIGSEGVRGFMDEHQRDKQLFGGACGETRWLGLEIVRRLAQETRDRDALDKYAELMLRLSSEIVALGAFGAGAPTAEEISEKLEQRLGLRRLLLQAEAEAPAEAEDPRIRVFCSAEAPDVFHAIEHANQIWTRDPFDVPSVQAAPRAVFSRLLQRAARQSDSGTGRVLLVLGESGAGKTHLMRIFRNQVHGERQGYVGYMQMAGAPDNYARYVLGSLVDSLEKPYDAPEVPESALLCLSDTLLLAPESIDAEQRNKLQDGELPDDELCDLVYRLADLVVSETRFSKIDLDLIRALLFLQRREPRYYGRVIKYLRGQPLSRHDAALLGDLAPRTDNPFGLLEAIGRLIACVDGGALVLLLDQLEDIYNQPGAKDQFVRLMDVVRLVSDSVPNSLIVVSCLNNMYPELKVHLTRSVLDRLEHDPEPQRLVESRSLPEIEAVVERRLNYLYESQGVRHRAEEPHFPIPRALLESQRELRLRDVLKHLQSFQHACIGAGAIVGAGANGLASMAGAVAAPAKAAESSVLAALTTAWAQFAERAEEVPGEDEFTGLLSWALTQCAHELPSGVAMAVQNDGTSLIVDAPDRGDGSSRLLVRLTNQGSRVLAQRIESANYDAKKAGRIPVVVRCSDFGGKPGTALHRQLGHLAKEGGRRVVFEQATWKTLLAFKSFCDGQRAAAGFGDWLKAQRPLLSLGDMRAVFGYPQLSVDGKDSFVAAPVQSSKPAAVVVSPPFAGAPSPLQAPASNENAPSTSLPPDPKLLRVGTIMSLKQDVALLELERLKRHCAFLGASGSGKTSLALNVIEQAAQRGIGVILLDRKGDLATLADPESWDRPDADARRAKRKRQLRDQLHVRMYVPGHAQGPSLSIRAVPAGLAELPQPERSHLARFAAQGLGSMMGLRSTQADQALLAILAKTIEVIGQLSARRDLGLRDLIELLANEDESLIAELGRLDLKLCKKLIDGLEVLRLNHGALLESSAPALSAQALLGRDGSVPKGKVPVTIISTKFLGGPQRVDFWVSQLLAELSRWCSRSPADKLQALLFLDEADAYLPAVGKPATKEPLLDLLKRARSAGLGVMLATQSPGDLDYKARDNIGTWWVGRIGSPTAIEKMKPLLSDCRIDVSGSLATSGTGEFFQISEGHSVRIRSDRSLTDTVQLTEERILALAQALLERVRVVA